MLYMLRRQTPHLRCCPLFQMQAMNSQMCCLASQRQPMTSQAIAALSITLKHSTRGGRQLALCHPACAPACHDQLLKVPRSLVAKVMSQAAETTGRSCSARQSQRSLAAVPKAPLTPVCRLHAAHTFQSSLFRPAACGPSNLTTVSA